MSMKIKWENNTAPILPLAYEFVNTFITNFGPIRSTNFYIRLQK